MQNFNDMMPVTLSFEYLLSHMFGKQSYHGFVGAYSASEWKKHILKIIKAMQNAIVVNIDIADECHKRNLFEICRSATETIKKEKTKDMINLYTIEYLVRIIFELMGKMPDNWARKVVNRLCDWKLNKYRKIIYTQTKRQKVNLIVSLPNGSLYRRRFKDTNELFYKLVADLKGDSDKFLQWFKEKYPDLYLKLF